MNTTKRKSKYKKRKGFTLNQSKKYKQSYKFNKLSSLLFWIILIVLLSILSVFIFRTFIGPYSFRLKSMYGLVTYPKGEVRGIDISHHQEDIDWNKLRNADIQGSPISFIFIKATEGKDYLDENFNLNFHNAKKNEIVRGAYHFFSTKSSAESQANFFCKMVQLDTGDLPPVLDIETQGNYTKTKLRNEVLRWLQIVENRYGVKPIIYTYHKFRREILNTHEFNEYPFWIAHYYVDSLNNDTKWHFWQHTDVGKVNGINGYVDINLYNGTYEDFINIIIKDDSI